MDEAESRESAYNPPMTQESQLSRIRHAFLSSPEAKYITGTILNVDGGSDLGDASANALG